MTKHCWAASSIRHLQQSKTDLLAQQICNVLAQYHTRSNSWSADLLVQQIRDVPAQYYTRSISWSAD